MIILETTSEILEIATSTASALDVVVSYLDIASLSASGVGSQETAISSITTTTILSAPAASTQRQIKFISILNKGATANSITLKKDISATEYSMYICTLLPSEKLLYNDGGGFEKHTANGEKTDIHVTDKTKPLSASSFNIIKVGTVAEAAGVWHSLAFATGMPGVWSTGSPGLNGRATDGTSAADLGCVSIKNPATGTNYLTGFSGAATTSLFLSLLDVLWVNTGLVVTTLTAQAITPASLPARDQVGTSNGEGVSAGILVTTATTNAGAITNTTISYTNQSGTAGKTGTISSFPATAVAGTLVPFQLATGDTGIRSVQSVTLGTSYAAGAISLVLFKIVAGFPSLVANAGGQLTAGQATNTRLHNGACLLPFYLPTVTTATNVFATLNVEEK